MYIYTYMYICIYIHMFKYICVCVYIWYLTVPLPQIAAERLSGCDSTRRAASRIWKKKIHNRKKIRFRFLRVRFHKESCIKNLEKKSDSTNRKQKSDSALRTLLHIGLYINMFSHCICIYNTHILCIYKHTYYCTVVYVYINVYAYIIYVYMLHTSYKICTVTVYVYTIHSSYTIHVHCIWIYNTHIITGPVYVWHTLIKSLYRSFSQKSSTGSTKPWKYNIKCKVHV